MADKIISPTTLHRPGTPAAFTTARNAPAHLHHLSYRDPGTGAVDASITVSVAVPTSNAKSAAAATPAVKDWPATADVGRVPGRKLLNIFFQDASGNPVNTFDPPLELRVKIHPDDRLRNTGQTFWLAHWDGKQWVEIPDAWVSGSPGGKFYVAPSVSSGGGDDIVVHLAYWPDDPAIGAGP